MNTLIFSRKVSLILTFSAAVLSARAELRLPAVFGDHMVLQQKLANPVWGWDDPGTKVTVSLSGQSKTAEAGADGKWRVTLDPLPANATPAVLTIAGTNTREIQDVLIGEVWICSGQSNMGFDLNRDWNADVEKLAANLPQLRLISVPQVGTQELQDDFKGAWQASTPETCGSFSAVGFLYGRYLQQALQVPVGMIDNAWGGSAAEAWIRRENLEGDPRFARLTADWKTREAQLQSPEAKEQYEKQMAAWRTNAAEAKAAGNPAPRQPEGPDGVLRGNQRPGNIFNGVLNPTIGYGIKGAIWYQGESNADRAAEYRELFPFMIDEWRREWKQGDFPFYWVQLADFKQEVSEPGDSNWAELREAQSRTMALPATGQAVIIDLGEANDIHPRNKHDVAARLVRWPLAKDYGFKLECQSPTYKDHAVNGNKMTVNFTHTGGGLKAVDVNEVQGFAICGEDRKWVKADAQISGDSVSVWSAAVPQPVAVRYAWADNPVCNVISDNGLPLTPFRTDDFPMVTLPKP